MSYNNNPFNQNKVQIDGIKHTRDNTDLFDNKSFNLVPSYYPPDIVLWFPSILEILNISCIKVIGKPINSLTLKGIKDLQIFDLAYSSLFDCNYTVNGFQNMKILNISHFKCGLLNHYLLQSAVNLVHLIMESSSLSIGRYDDHRSKFLSGLKRLQ